MQALYLCGYFSYWDSHEFSDMLTPEEKAGFLAAAYEVITGRYLPHTVYGNLGVILSPW